MAQPADDRDGNVAESGGDPVCWLPRVCPECGLFSEIEPPTRCTRCGAPIPAD